MISLQTGAKVRKISHWQGMKTSETFLPTGAGSFDDILDGNWELRLLIIGRNTKTQRIYLCKLTKT